MKSKFLKMILPILAIVFFCSTVVLTVFMVINVNKINQLNTMLEKELNSKFSLYTGKGYDVNERTKTIAVNVLKGNAIEANSCTIKIGEISENTSFSMIRYNASLNSYVTEQISTTQNFLVVPIVLTSTKSARTTIFWSEQFKLVYGGSSQVYNSKYCYVMYDINKSEVTYNSISLNKYETETLYVVFEIPSKSIPGAPLSRFDFTLKNEKLFRYYIEGPVKYSHTGWQILYTMNF